MNHLEMLENIEDALDNYVRPLPRQIYERTNHFEDFSNDEFFKRFRLTKETTLFVLEQIENQLEYADDRNNSLTPINQLLLALRIYATGGHQLQIADFMQCDVSTVCRILQKVSLALCSLYGRHIYMPRNALEIAATQNKFFGIRQFPRVIGVVDGTHVRINSPGGNFAETYRNRKGYFSVNVQIIANANYEVLDIVARWPGSAHDSTIFNSSRIKTQFEGGRFGNGILLADSAYTNNAYTFTPFLNVGNRAEEKYNVAHKRTRVIVENTIGIWKRRFPVTAYGCRYKLDNVWPVIIATAVLHNIARRRGENEPPIENEVWQHELQLAIANGEIPVNVDGVVNNNARRLLVDNYFSTL